MDINYNTHLSYAKNFRQRFLILHYTAGNYQNSVAALTSKGGSVSAHYLVPTLKEIDPTYPENNIIPFSLVPEELRAWHAGVSAWKNRTNLNDCSIGIENVNMATDEKFEPYPDKQVEVIIWLCNNILSRYPDISPTNVLGHSDIAVGRKIDPGPLFPWERLYKEGIGAWYNQTDVDRYKQQFLKEIPTVANVVSKLHDYGYRYDGDARHILSAFQMHFRPTDYSGKLDVETAAIAYALVDKYI